MDAGPGRVEARPEREATGRAEERKLILLLLRDETKIPAAAEAIDPARITSDLYRELFRELVRTGGLQDRGPLALEVGPEARRLLEELLGDKTELGDADRVFRELVANIRAQALFDRIDELQKVLAESRGEEQDEAFRELAEVKTVLRELGSELSALGFKLSKRYRRYLRI